MSLEGVKKGDKLILCGGYGGDRRVVEVDRITKTQIILCGNYHKYRIKDGYIVGGSDYFSQWLRLPEGRREFDEIAEEQHRRQIIAKLGRRNWASVDTLKLNKIYDILIGVEDDTSRN
jgi:hypothetical protein